MTVFPAPPAAGLPDLSTVVADHAYPVLFATVSGAHLYGFPSRDSDVDLRGVHLLPLREVVGLRQPPGTCVRTWDEDGVEMDLVTHDLAKFARLLLRPNGYVLEQLLSPLVVRSSPEHRSLVELVPQLLTRGHARHYRGFAHTQWRLFERTGQLKPLLYTFRVLLSGIHLMREAEVLAHLPSLTEAVRAPDYLGDLVQAKAEAEHGPVPDACAPHPERLAADIRALHDRLDAAEQATVLPETHQAWNPVEDLVVGVRVGGQ